MMRHEYTLGDDKDETDCGTKWKKGIEHRCFMQNN